MTASTTTAGYVALLVTGGVALTVRFVFNSGADPLGTVNVLDWGDGTTGVLTNPLAPSAGFSIAHTFPAAGGAFLPRLEGVAQFSFLAPDATPLGFSKVGIFLDPNATGTSLIAGSALADFVIGGAFNDVLTAAAGDDTIWAGAGNDVVAGVSGNDTLVGEAGNDFLAGGVGNDLLDGDAGADTLWGNSGADTLRGAEDDDVLEGGSGDDLLYGMEGADRLSGGAGADSLVGGGSFGGGGADLADTIRGGAGDDIIHGVDGDDLLYGDAGHDLIYGMAGADRLVGGAGADTLVGGEGADLLVSSADGARDIFVLTDFFSADRILGFVGGEDRIAIGGAALPVQSGPTRIATGGGPTLVFDTRASLLLIDHDGAGGAAAVLIARLPGVAALSAADFLFGS
jgi:Ca2+-binding RTX toxin-like protein